MPLPELLKSSVTAKLTAFCEKKVPKNIRHKLRLSFEFRGNSVTLIENRPYFKDPSEWTKMKVAQFRFAPANKTWTLYCRRQNERWYHFDLVPASKNIEPLIQAVEADVTGIFWG